MAHIPDGVLSAPVLIGGAVLAVGGLALGLRRLDEAEIPKTAMLASTFFVASLVAVPVGPSSVHLLLSGLMGLVLGAARHSRRSSSGCCFRPCCSVSAASPRLGSMSSTSPFPASPPRLIARPMLARAQGWRVPAIGAAVAAFAVIGTAGCVSLALALSSAEYLPSLRVIALTYIPLALVEALLTGFVVSYLKRVKPESPGLDAATGGRA